MKTANWIVLSYLGYRLPDGSYGSYADCLASSGSVRPYLLCRCSCGTEAPVRAKNRTTPASRCCRVCSNRQQGPRLKKPCAVCGKFVRKSRNNHCSKKCAGLSRGSGKAELEKMHALAVFPARVAITKYIAWAERKGLPFRNRKAVAEQFRRHGIDFEGASDLLTCRSFCTMLKLPVCRATLIRAIAPLLWNRLSMKWLKKWLADLDNQELLFPWLSGCDLDVLEYLLDEKLCEAFVDWEEQNPRPFKNRPRPVQVGGKSYPSVEQAAKAHHVERTTLARAANGAVKNPLIDAQWA